MREPPAAFVKTEVDALCDIGVDTPAEIGRHLSKQIILNESDDRRRGHLPLDRDFRNMLDKRKRSKMLCPDDQDNLEAILIKRKVAEETIIYRVSIFLLIKRGVPFKSCQFFPDHIGSGNY